MRSAVQDNVRFATSIATTSTHTRCWSSDAQVPQPWKAGLLRRADNRQRLITFNDAPQRRPEQAPFAYRRLGLQDFRQRVARPAAPGQFLIQLGPASRNHRSDGRAEFAATPQAVGELAR